MSSGLNRGSVREFFNYDLKISRPGWVKAQHIVCPTISIVVATILATALSSQGLLGFAIAIIGGGLTYASLTLLIKSAGNIHLGAARRKRLKEFGKLARDTQQIQRMDFERAFQRIVKRANIEPQFLKTFTSEFVPEREINFFSTKALRASLGEYLASQFA